MKNKEYTDYVANGAFPIDKLVPLDKPYKDNRGIIQNLILTPGITTISIITSNAGSVRSNHFHKTDWHYLYVVSGLMEYYERDIDGSSDIEPIVVKAGQMVFTPPNEVHKTIFLQDTILMSFAKNMRDHEHHENDVVRMEF